jgi:molybdate transport system ATP-binding protein
MSGPDAIRAAFRGTLGRFNLDVAFTVPAVGVTGLFGPSGCGKTTTLRCMAGLERLAEGFCAINGDVWQDGAMFRPTYRRPVGYVFQEASLFPHLSVRRNLLYGARDAGSSPARNGIGLGEVTELLGLGSLLDRSPHNLSGGERQRVAIGRALLSQPKLLLMDEPLSALDRRAKDEILPFIERLHDSFSMPIVYVSHDMAELERFTDHLVLMERGRVLAAGPLSDLQGDPLLPLAGAKEAAVSLDARVEAYDPEYGLLTLSVEGGRFLVPAPAGGAAGTRQRLRVVAGDVSLAREPLHASTILNILPARILQGRLLGQHEMIVVLRLGFDGTGARLLARVTRRSWEQLALAEGMEAYAQIKSVALAPAPEI